MLSNNNTNEMLTSLQDNMLTLKNINNFTKDMFNDIEQVTSIFSIEKIKSNSLIENVKKVSLEDNIYKIKHKDTLFWCFYIFKYGISKYEIDSDKYFFSIEKEEKYKYISILRNNKDLLKKNGIKSVSEIENDLANKEQIGVKTFISLCIVEKINIFLVDNRKYYELIFDNNNTNIIHKENNKYYIDLDNNNIKLENYRNNYLLINSCEYKLKAISSYKLEELIDLAKRLQIDIHNNSTKKITKKDIYEKLIINFR